jgi:hypothetical protein
VRFTDVERRDDCGHHFAGGGDRGERDERRAARVLGREPVEELEACVRTRRPAASSPDSIVLTRKGY